MERKIVNDLLRWKASGNRMPLILHGARQVGKTYTALFFGKEHYKNTVYFNMEDSVEVAGVFERDLNPERILKELDYPEGGYAVFFDEIQACERV